MATSTGVGRGQPLEFTLGEFTGALGDSVTVLPVVVAVAALTPAALAHLLLGFAVFQVVWGVRYGLPVSVEPMKALAGLVIAGTLSYGEVVAAGLLAGVVLLALGRADALAAVARHVGRPAVRGVQFGVALLLLVAGVELAAGDPRLAALGIVVACGATLVDRRAGALAVLAAGTAVAAIGGWGGGGGTSVAVGGSLSAMAAGAASVVVGLPSPSVFPAGTPAFTRDALAGLAGQLAMTVGNAAVATSVLFADLYDADVSPDDLAESMGTMNLLAVPVGAFPMCHGSGGLAGKHAFGARTGGANVVLGVVYAGAALVAGLWTGFPVAMLGVLLVVVAWQLGRVALEADRRWLVLGTGALALATNVGVAFLAAAAADKLADRR